MGLLRADVLGLGIKGGRGLHLRVSALLLALIHEPRRRLEFSEVEWARVGPGPYPKQPNSKAYARCGPGFLTVAVMLAHGAL